MRRRRPGEFLLGMGRYLNVRFAREGEGLSPALI
jgi:hypothetical protein